MASTHFHNGTIWRGAGVDTADALLVHDGVVAAVGSADVDRHLAALDTASDSDDTLDQVDLDGGFLMPSFGDGHAHPIFGGLEAEGPQVRTCSSVDEIVAEVRRFAQAHPEIEWITGASYDGSLVDGGLFDARWLDEAVADRPVVLRAWDYHTVWCNSRALELAGITAETPEPELGEIPRRGDGSPLGTLREWGAVDLVDAVRPPLDEAVRLRALERAADYYLERGVTWVQDAWVEPADIETYIAASTRGRLTLRFNLALYADPRHFSAQLPALVEARRRVEEHGDPLLSARTVKFFADGVVENETGSLLEPYCSSLHNHGLRVWDGETLAEAVRAVDAAGFQVHIHAIGDAAVRQALDAIESAIAANGPRDRRPVIAHAQLVDSADLSRFAEIGVIANMQPLWAQLDDLMTVLTVPRLGESRASNQYRIRRHPRARRASLLRLRLAVHLGHTRRGAGDRHEPSERCRRTCRGLDTGGDRRHRPRSRHLFDRSRVPGLRRYLPRDLGRDPPRGERRSHQIRPRPPASVTAGTRGDSCSHHLPLRRCRAFIDLRERTTMSRSHDANTAHRGEESHGGEGQLRRALGVPSLVLFGLVYMVPLTVFTTYGIVTQVSGGRVPLAYVITLLAMVFTARSYAKMAHELPFPGPPTRTRRIASGRASGSLPAGRFCWTTFSCR